MRRAIPLTPKLAPGHASFFPVKGIGKGLPARRRSQKSQKTNSSDGNQYQKSWNNQSSHNSENDKCAFEYAPQTAGFCFQRINLSL